MVSNDAVFSAFLLQLGVFWGYGKVADVLLSRRHDFMENHILVATEPKKVTVRNILPDLKHQLTIIMGS